VNSILSGLAGALILACTTGFIYLLLKAWKGLAALTASFQKVSDGLQAAKVHYFSMSHELSNVSLQLKKLSGELEFLRTMMTAGAPPEAEPGAPENPAAPRGPSGKPIPQFPTWQPFVASVDVPDAAESDTEIIDTSDEELVQQEQLDEIRGNGFAAGPEADPMENPPGVTANV
jgi:hypothetical protein